MTCNCVHSTVCIHRNKIANSLNEIIEPRFGGLNQQWLEVEAFIASIWAQYGRKPRAALRKERKMCTYGISVQDIYDAVNNCLDGMEGDFDRASLNQALDEVKKDYKYVSDSEEEHGKAKSARIVRRKTAQLTVAPTQQDGPCNPALAGALAECNINEDMAIKIINAFEKRIK